MVSLALILPLGCAPSPSADAANPSGGGVRLVQVAEGFKQITDLQFPPGVSDRLVVLEKGGAATWLDLSTGAQRLWFEREVRSNSELGLLGLAFHPSYPDTGRVYINYNPAEGALRTVIAELSMDGEQQQAGRERALLQVEQPFGNHDAGQLRFGPDAMLYVGLGDGGSGGDPLGNGQNLNTLLGAMLRIDVSPGPDGAPYTVPPDNPHVGRAGARPEIWASGLRNPWRFSFAPDGRLIVADVGQNEVEEVDIVARGDNLGWNITEGSRCFKPESGCDTTGLVPPIFEYDHGVGVSITGGYVAYGAAPAALHGWYVLADFGTGRCWGLDLRAPLKPGQQAPSRVLGELGINPSTFGQAADGTLYVADFRSGKVFRIE